MQFGASTACLYPMESEKSLKIMCECGYRHFEFFVNAGYEISHEFLREFKNIADGYGADFVSMHPFTSSFETNMFFGVYERLLAESIDNYRRFFEAAAYLGAKIFVLHGQKISRQGKFAHSDEFYCERFNMLRDAAAEFGVTLCQENVFLFRSHSSEFIRNMKNILGDKVHFVFDIKQAIRSGEDPYAMLDAMGDSLYHVHLSDNSKDNTCLLPGCGDFDIPALLNHLKKRGFNGNIITEVYRHSFSGTENLNFSQNFMKKLFIDNNLS